MTDQLVSFETAKLAKEKGFDEDITKAYDEKGIIGFKSYCYSTSGVFYKTNDLSKKQPEEVRSLVGLSLISAPTQSLLQKWLREIQRMDIVVNVNAVTNEYRCTIPRFILGDWKSNNHNTYEEALEEGLFVALKLL